MRLKKLELTNFKGARDYCFTPDGENASVFGSNGTGKTTLFDALCWLLYDKGSDPDGKNFSPKTTDADGNELHNLDNSVRGTFALEDGTIITLQKTMSEDWVAKRGSAEKTFSGNKTAYYIDAVPVNQGEYKRRVEALCPADKAQILTRPLFFPSSLHWQDRRQILLELCGDVSDADVINGNSALAELQDFLRKPGGAALYSVDEWRAIAAAKLKAANERMKEIPQRIDEAGRGLPDVSGLDAEALHAQKREEEAKRDELLQQKAALASDDGTQAIRKKIVVAQVAISQQSAAFEKRKAAELSGYRDSINSLSAEKRSRLDEVMFLEVSGKRLAAKLDAMLQERATQTELYKSCKASVFSGSTVCPTCGQAFPEEQIKESQERFNTNKAERLEAIRAHIEANCSKSQIADVETRIGENTEKLNAAQAAADRASAEIDAIKIAMAPIEAQSYTGTDDYASRMEDIAALEAQLSAGNTAPSDEKAAAETALTACGERLESISAALASIAFAKQRQARISELEAEQRTVAEEYERLMKGVYLCEQFIKAKVSMLTERINAHFKTVRFRLFDVQINGGIKECCEVLASTSNGLKLFAEANDAAKLCAGLEIIDTLSRAYGISMPVFVDNAESVVQLPQIAPQVIRLVVSGADKALRVETEADT